MKVSMGRRRSQSLDYRRNGPKKLLQHTCPLRATVDEGGHYSFAVAL
jgi:hypothetical protein